MSCRDFEPSVERFCSNPADFVSEAQFVQMASYFGIKGPELTKIKIIASREVQRRSLVASGGAEADQRLQQREG